jgi:A/G-specific adenine glycosylase
VKHVLTHKDLYLHPVALRLSGQKSLGQGHWVDQQSIAAIGLPAPIRKLVA